MLAELGVLVACLGVAFAVVWLLRGSNRPAASVLFGERIVDGVLFPALALGLAFAARVAMEGMLRPAVFRIAIPILLSLLVIRLAARVLGRTFPDVRWVRTIERTISWFAWIAVILWLTGVGPIVLEAMDDVSWKLGGTRTSLRTIVEGVLIAGLVVVLVLWVSAALERKLLAGAASADVSLRKIVATLLRSVLLVVGLMVALSAVGIDLTALSVLGGAVGVGIGFGLQKIAANYVSGFVILAERSVRIGDLVKVDGFEGRITDIRTRYTVVRAMNGRESVVPNELFITQRVENSSLADRRVQVRTRVQVAYGTNVQALQPRLEAAVGAVPRVLAEPAPAVALDAFAADGIDLDVAFWIDDPENGQGNVRSDVNMAILALLDEAGVEIPFPQRRVHAVLTRGAAT